MAHSRNRRGRVSGIGPVSSGRTYSRNLNRYNRSKNNNMKVTGVGPIADGDQYARNIEAARKKSSAAAAAAAKAKAAAEAKAKAEAAAKAKAAEEKRVRMFDPSRLSDTFTGNNNLGINTTAAFGSPAVQNFAGTSFDKASSWYNRGRLPNESKMSIRDLFRNDLKQQQQIGKFNPNRKLNLASYARGESNPFRGMPGYGSITGQGEVKGGFQTGPTPSVRQAIERPLKLLGSGLNLLKNPKLAIAGAFAAPTALADGTLEGKPTRFDTAAGGLNIGGGVDSEEGFGNSNTGRVLNDIGNAINTYKGIFNDSSAIKNAVAPKPKFATFREDAAEQAALNEANNFTPNSADVRSDIKSLFASGMNYKDVANTVSDARTVVEGGAEGFKSLSESQQKNLVNSAGGIIDNSKVFESFGEKYTGRTPPKFADFRVNADDQAALNEASATFKDQTQDSLAAYNQTIQEASQDTKGRVDPINNLLKNFNNIEGYGTTSRFLNTLSDPNFVNTRQRIQAAYDPTSPKAKALSFPDRNLVGSFGNLLIGGKLSDIFKANNPTERGTTFTPTDTANLVANTMIAANTPGSLTQKRFGEIGGLTGQGTEVTAGSLIRGTFPRGGGRTNNVSGGSGRQPVLQTAPAAVQQEYPLPIIPQTGVVNNNLQNIQQNAYNNQMSMYATNPNYFAQFRPQQRFPRRGSFRSSFSRDYFN